MLQIYIYMMPYIYGNFELFFLYLGFCFLSIIEKSEMCRQDL